MHDHNSLLEQGHFPSGAAEPNESAAGTVRRALLSGFFLFHFTALVLGNLPWSPFIAVVYPTYAWYLRSTGQLQDWGMYSRPDHIRTTLWLTAHFDDGRVEYPWGDTVGMSPRRVYLLESLIMRNDRDQEADRFLWNIMNRYPVDDQPRRIELGMESWPTYGFEVQDLVTPPEPIRRNREVHR